jgi:lysozyme family protein
MIGNMKVYDPAMEHILKFEGGYVNDPDDPGGETNFGISKRAYPDVDMKTLTEHRAKEIYYNDYWIRYKADRLTPDLQIMFFDMCINIGGSGSIKILQKTANQKLKKKLKVDGKIGIKTIAGTKALSLDRLTTGRIKYYSELVAKKPKLDKYYYGWIRRTLSAWETTKNLDLQKHHI